MNESNAKTVASLYLIRSYNHESRRSGGPHPLEGLQEDRNTPNRRSMTTTSRSQANQPQRTQQVRHINYGNAQNFEIWQVARAATAAPFYFDPLQIGDQLFEDGAIGPANNPTQEGMLDIEETSGAESVGIVVSIGTARLDKRGRKSTKSMLKRIVNEGTNPDIIHYDILGQSKQPRLKGMSYYRMNPVGSDFRLDIEFDEWSPRTSRFRSRDESGSSTLKKIEDSFYRWTHKHWVASDFKDCATRLVECRRARTGDGAKWERYATGAKFTCPFQGCEQRELFFHRGEFEDHMSQEHSVSGEKLPGETKTCKKNWVYRAPAS